MREIIFRGKNDDFGEWVEGSLFHDPDLEQYLIFGFDYYNGVTGLERDEFCYHIIPSTVGQYTGFKDKNGKKIFDGHIIRNLKTKETAVVQWFPEHSAFMVWCKSSNEVGFLYECTKSNIEVIGNIYDNPELLEQEG